MMINISCGDRDITGPDDGGITLFDLRVTSIGLEVILSWDAIDNSDLTGYNIYRQFNDSNFEKYASVSSEEISFTDRTVTAEIRYEYQITAELTNDRESEPSETVRIIPGLTTTWVLDNSTGILSELTHDVAHKTGKFFSDLPSVVAFDIDQKNGYVYLLNRFDKTLMLYVEGQEPSTFGTIADSDTVDMKFDDPSDIDYDSVEDDMWIADGLSGNIYHYSQNDPGKWVLADSLNTGGSADVGQIADNGDYWVLNTKGESVEIYQKRNTGYNRINIGGFSSVAIILALDEKRARAYAVDLGTGTGIETPISTINQVFSAAVEPESGDLWLLADDDGSGSYELIKLSDTGGRIFEIDTGMSDPTWMGVNSYNMNVVVLNRTFDEPKVATFDKLGNNINTFDSLTEPVRARIVKLD